MARQVLLVLVLSFGLAGLVRSAYAHTFTKVFADGCCCEDAVDCTVSGSANPVCNQGHRIDTGSLRACGDFVDYLPGGKCFLTGCIGDTGQCRPDVGPTSLLSPAPAPPEVPLNSLDDDCDGLIDECVPGDSLLCSTPIRSCSALVPGTTLCAANGFPSNTCVAPQQANPDFCPKAACLGGVIDNTDTDGDGLFDCWEDQGIDYDGDGTIDFVLPAANKLHKDVYVEVDYFDCTVAGGDCPMGNTHVHSPTAPTVAAVVQTFANAPVNNPDSVTGVTMHMLVDEALPHKANCAFDATCYTPTKMANFGTAGERANQNARLAKRLVYRYSLWVHDLSANNSTSGFANVPSVDNIISLGSWTGQVGTTLEQAGTFVHEFGHDLGLGHGGGDGTNFKPNYLSVMSYRFQTTGLIPGNIIDYSTTALPNLTEVNLSEPAGIGDGAFNTFFVCPNGSTRTGAGNMPINWDCLPIPPDAADDLNVSGDINGDRVCIGPGVDTILQSVSLADDVAAGGSLQPGPNLVLDSVPLGDDVIVGAAVLPGPDGIIQTVPLMDDQLRGVVIWDGGNRVCESATQADDAFVRNTGSVQPAALNGFDDWANLQYEFAARLVGFGMSQGASPAERELDLPTAKNIETQSKIADLSIGQTITRAADGSISIRLMVSNHGFDTAVLPTVNDRLPPDVVFKSCTATGGGQCRLLGGYLSVAFEALAAGRTETATVVVCSGSAGVIANVASILGSSTDPNPANNTATAVLSPPNAWSANTTYRIGDLVVFNGAQFRCVQAHRSVVGWEPTNAPALWSRPAQCATSAWIVQTPYLVGDLVTFGGRTYRCVQAHTAQTDWTPARTPALWRLVP